ncbi:MAG TPA: hypothetical protein ENG03_11320 [Thioploca sp.]|nr:hypothetical protein [Thioploca sp.]
MTITTKHRYALPRGYQLQEYRIQSILGHGKFGITYLAYNIKLNCQVALKEYFPSDLVIRENSYRVQPKSQQDKNHFTWGLGRFFQEGQILAAFQHPNIVRVLRYFKAQNTAYIVMEYEQGQSLSTVLKNGGTVAEAFIMIILPPLLEGLQALHEAGFWHQDIRPDHIYLRDKDYSPVLLDFGAARYVLGQRRRRVTTNVAPGYAPFEQYQTKDHQGPWTDIYALGAVLYRAISGEIPVDAPKRIHAIKLRHQADPLPPAIQIGRQSYSKRLLQSVDWALRLAVKDRPQTVRQWAKVLLPSQPKALNLNKSPIYSVKRFGMVLTGVIVAIGLNVGYVFYTEQRMAQLQRQQLSESQKLQQHAAREKAVLQQTLEKTQQQLKQVQITIETKQKHLTQLQSEKAELHKILKTAQWQFKQAQTAKEKLEAKLPGNVFRDYLPDGSLGPEMVWIAAGRFRMGDIYGRGEDNEQPVHWVSVDSFAMGRYEVTFTEYEHFAIATGREKPSDEGWGRGNRPVINVSWYDAIAYAVWLSQQTGQKYRLPNEAEWEYAARAKTVTQSGRRNEIESKREHCEDCGIRDDKKTALVGSFAVNPLGLYDMAGNVREWTCSEYQEKYSGKEQRCITRQNSTRYRVERGGSWLHQSRDGRVSARYWSNPKNRYTNVGFRIVRGIGQ